VIKPDPKEIKKMDDKYYKNDKCRNSECGVYRGQYHFENCSIAKAIREEEKDTEEKNNSENGKIVIV